MSQKPPFFVSLHFFLLVLIMLTCSLNLPCFTDDLISLFISFHYSLGLQMGILLCLPTFGLSSHLCSTVFSLFPFLTSLPSNHPLPSLSRSLSAVHKLFGIYSMWPDARFPLGALFPGDGAGGLGCVTFGWRAVGRVRGGQACEERIGSKKEKKRGRERDLSMYLRQSERGW